MGRDKALLEIDGVPLVLRAARALAEVFSEVVIVSPFRKEYSGLGVELVEDSYRSCGPLGGLHAALARADGRPIFALACDYPLVNSSLIRYLVATEGQPANEYLPQEGQEPRASAAWARVAVWQDRIHPLCGLYSAACRETVEEYLASGERSVHGCLNRVETEVVVLTDELPLLRRQTANLNLAGLTSDNETLAESFRAGEES